MAKSSNQTLKLLYLQEVLELENKCEEFVGLIDNVAIKRLEISW